MTDTTYLLNETHLRAKAFQVQGAPEFAVSSRQSTSLKDPNWGLAWSNPNISDEVLIRKALISARFSAILQACLDFGLEHVRKQWDIVAQDSELTSLRTRSLVSDILGNITEGFSSAKA